MKRHSVQDMPLSELTSAPYNPRVITEEALDGLTASLSHFGLVQPIVWNKTTGHVVGGHQRVKVLERAGESSAQVVVVELDETEEKALNLALNNPHIEGEFTNDVYGLLSELQTDLPELFESLRLDDIATFRRRDLRTLLGEEGGPERGSEALDIFTPDEIVDDAVAYFRRSGFPYPHLELFEMKQELNKLANLPEEVCVRSVAGYQIADHFHHHRFHASAIGTKSPYEGFHDDITLRKALRMEYNGSRTIKKGYNGPMSLARGTQACSNFRPSFARMIYNRYCPKGGKVFDPSTGYGGRLVGFLASHAAVYSGSDPNTPTHNANTKLSETLGQHKEVNLFHAPFEDLDYARLPYAGAYDLAFTSPPYFCKEIYTDEPTNSCNRYPGYEAWVKGFLEPLLAGCFALLTPGGSCIINIADVRIKDAIIPLESDTVKAGRAAGFELKDTMSFPLSVRMHLDKKSGLVIEDQADESVFHFTKPA